MPLDGLSLDVLAAALVVAVIHTAAGPDHYLPFIALARARGWGRVRLVAITGACGLAHVLSSLVLGALGLALGATVGGIEALEEGRGSLAAWVLVAFGLAYGLWGLRRALRRRRGVTLHAHGAEGDHVHLHGDHPHSHGPGRHEAASSWGLFLVFVLGPCEPLIPLVFVPASQARWGLAGVTALVFGAATVGTMLALVLAANAGLARAPLGGLARWAHPLAGAVVAASGAAMLLGL